MHRILLLAPLILTLTGCQAEDVVPPDHNPTLLQTYEVRPEAAEEIGDAIGYLLGGEAAPLGRATVLGPDRIAVAAPASVHAGVESLLAAAADSLAGEPPRILLEYWLVDATPAGGFAVAKDLEGIGDALRQLTPSIGPMRYERADYARHTLRSGAGANVGGVLLSGSAEALARDDRIVGEFRLQAPGGKRVGTRIDLEQGETLVLAVVGNAPDQEGEPDAGGFGIFVVRAATF